MRDQGGYGHNNPDAAKKFLGSNVRPKGVEPNLYHSKILYKAGVDQHAVEMARLGTVIAAIEQPVAAQEDLFLLSERRIERQARGLLHDQRQIGTFQRIERRGEVDRFEVDGVDRVIGGEIAMIPRHQAALDGRIIEAGLDQVRGEIRLMIAEPHQEERVVGELALQPRQKVRIVLRAERLPAQIFVNRRHVAQILPLRHQVGPIAVVPGEMIGGQIDEDEHRAARMFLADHPRRSVEEKTVRFDIFRAQIVLIEEMLHAGRGLEALRAHEGAERRIERKRAITAAPQRRRQSALDSAGGNAGDEVREAAEGTRREAFQHVVFGEPAWSAIAFDQEIALLAVERLEMRAVAVRHLDARGHADVEARLVVDENNVRRLLGRRAALLANRLQAVGSEGVGLHEAVRHQFRDRIDAGAREGRYLAAAI